MKSCIHFLNTGHSDCIILESNGRFAMIDAAEDTEYPENKPSLNLPGYEDTVVDYINRHCRNTDGQIVFEFVLGTHAHSDHIGGFDTVILQDNVTVKKAYLKEYREEGIVAYERREWDNVIVYRQMTEALEEKGVPLIQSFDRVTEMLGDLRVTFYNGSYVPLPELTGENRNSVVTLVEHGRHRVLLAGDMNFLHGGEQEIADAVGKIDVLKVGHHCYEQSTSEYWLKTLQPRYAVVCNDSGRADNHVVARIRQYSQAEMLYTVDSDGILLTFGHELQITEKTM